MKPGVYFSLPRLRTLLLGASIICTRFLTVMIFRLPLKQGLTNGAGCVFLSPQTEGLVTPASYTHLVPT